MSLKIEPDKKKHFFVGIPLGAVLQWMAWYFFPQQLTISVAAGFTVLVAICYGFELFSLITGKGVADNLDAIAGIIGGIIGISVFWLMYQFY